MNIIISFSPTNQSYRVAQYFAKQLSWELFDLTSYTNQNKFDYHHEYEYVIIAFPIHSQTIPNPVKNILKKLKGKYFVIIATYGKMGTGDALNDAKKFINGKLIGAAYIPSKHSYIDNHEFIDFDKLEKLVSRVNSTEEINIPRRRRHILAKFFLNLRSRLNVKLRTNKNCTNCNYCNSLCPTNAIHKGRINKNCIRCLKCYNDCPNKALEIKYSFFLKNYLKKDKVNSLIIY